MWFFHLMFFISSPFFFILRGKMKTFKVLHDLVPISLSNLTFTSSPAHPSHTHLYSVPKPFWIYSLHSIIFLCFHIFGCFCFSRLIQFYSILKPWLLSSSPESHSWHFLNWRQSYFSVHFLYPLFMNMLINFCIGFLLVTKMCFLLRHSFSFVICFVCIVALGLRQFSH